MGDRIARVAYPEKTDRFVTVVVGLRVHRCSSFFSVRRALFLSPIDGDIRERVFESGTRTTATRLAPDLMSRVVRLRQVTAVMELNSFTLIDMSWTVPPLR
jgi:hypothetical protein